MPKRRATPKPETTPPPEGDPADLCSPEERCTVNDWFQVSHDKNGKTYLKAESFPSYVEDDIWAILQDCGFTYSQGYRSEALNIQPVDREDDVRRLLVRIGLPPNLEEEADEEDDPVKLKKWVAFANVPLKEKDLGCLKTLPVPSDYQALVCLGKLGFQFDGKAKKIVRPKNEGGMDEYNSVAELRAFVRSAGNDSLLGSAEGGFGSPRKRARRGTRKQDMPLADEEMLALRLWGALSPAPLPVCGERYVVDEAVDMEIDAEEKTQAKKKAKKEPKVVKTTGSRAVAEVQSETAESKDKKKSPAAAAKKVKATAKKPSTEAPRVRASRRAEVAKDKKRAPEKAQANTVGTKATPKTTKSVSAKATKAKGAKKEPAMGKKIVGTKASPKTTSSKPAKELKAKEATGDAKDAVAVGKKIVGAKATAKTTISVSSKEAKAKVSGGAKKEAAAGKKIAGVKASAKTAKRSPGKDIKAKASEAAAGKKVVGTKSPSKTTTSPKRDAAAGKQIIGKTKASTKTTKSGSKEVKKAAAGVTDMIVDESTTAKAGAYATGNHEPEAMDTDTQPAPQESTSTFDKSGNKDTPSIEVARYPPAEESSSSCIIL